MRDGYAEFIAHGSEILAIGPDTPESFVKYWRENRIPFIGLPDVGKKVAKLYRQEISLFKLGRMPLSIVVDREGLIRFVHYGYSMSDIPDNAMLLQGIDEM